MNLRDTALVSNCCKADMRTAGGTTMHFVCRKCGKPCDGVPKHAIRQKNAIAPPECEKIRADATKAEFQRLCTFAAPIRTVSEANVREHWAVKAKRAKSQRGQLTMAWVNFFGRDNHPPMLPVIATLTRIGVRKLDDDNLQRAFKAVRDQIAKHYNVDDGDDQIEWRYAQRKGEPKEYFVQITLETKQEKP